MSQFTNYQAPQQKLCQCGVAAKQFEIKKEDSPDKGRWFWGCGNNRECKMFEFADGQPSRAPPRTGKFPQKTANRSSPYKKPQPTGFYSADGPIPTSPKPSPPPTEKSDREVALYLLAEKLDKLDQLQTVHTTETANLNNILNKLNSRITEIYSAMGLTETTDSPQSSSQHKSSTN